MSKDKIKNLCEYIDSNRAKNYPINNSYLAEATDYLKNSYFKMLAVILQEGKELKESQSNLFSRQIAGAKCDCTMSDYLRQALEIEIDEYVNFIQDYKNNNIRYRFVLDAILLTSVGERDYNQLKLLASFIESLSVNKVELKYLAQLARSGLEQSSAMYVTAMQNKPIDIQGDIATDYLINYIRDNVLSNEEITIITTMTTENVGIVDLNKITNISTPKIQLSNITIDVANYDLIFDGFQSVLLSDCVFENGNRSIVFKNCINVEIVSCKFKDFTKYVLIEENVTNVVIKNTNFENCVFEYWSYADNWSKLGFVIHSEKPKNNGLNYLLGCKFIGCIGKNTVYRTASAFISNIRSELDGCYFENCWHYREGYLDYESEARTMFTAESKAINCEVVNSAKIV